MHPSARRIARGLRRLAIVPVSVLTVLAMSSAASANVPLKKVSHDPFTNLAGNLWHQTQVEPDTFGWGSTIVSVFQTGRYTDGGSDDTGWATSTDAGATWHHGFMPGITAQSNPPGPYLRVSDPSVAYDPKHKVWLGFSLTVDNVNTALVNRSTDGGLTWKKPVIVSTPSGGSDYDKTWIACDTWSASPNYGTCYTEWDNYVNGDTVMMSRSTDGGKTWTLASVAGAHGLGGQPVAQPNGNVVVPYLADAGQIQSIVSTDGGKTYTGPYTVSSQSDHGVVGMRTEPLPSAEIDGNGQGLRGLAGLPLPQRVQRERRRHVHVDERPVVVVGRAHPDRLGRRHGRPLHPGDRRRPGHVGRHGAPGADVLLLPERRLLVRCLPAGRRLRQLHRRRRHVVGADADPRADQPVRGCRTPAAGSSGDYISTSIVGGVAHTVIANATGSSCVPNQLKACHEPMVSPKNGMAITGGSRVARSPAIRSVRSDHVALRHPIL